jgi:serine/threonine protein kinase
MATRAQFGGQTIDHYRILDQIGAGGMGVVYRAHDHQQLKREVSLVVQLEIHRALSTNQL